MTTIFKWIIIIVMGIFVYNTFIKDKGYGEQIKEIANIDSTQSTDAVSDGNTEYTNKDFSLNPNASSKYNAAPSSASNGLTSPQQNAVRSANQYLSISGFSRDGLIRQLSADGGDGYSSDDAIAAVNSLNVDWNEQAVRSAKQYLDITGFSCDGLIAQLSEDGGDGYTPQEAKQAATLAGACA